MEQSTTPPKNKKVAATYQNNPFYVATEGLEKLFKYALSVGIFLAVISALSLVGSPGSLFQQNNGNSNADNTQVNQDFSDWVSSIPAEVWTTVAVVVLLVLIVMAVIGVVFKGIGDFTASRLARGETVTLGDAFKGVFSRFWGYAWVLVIVGVKTFLWTLLFIIPGIIMSIRYSLSGVSFFDTEKKGNAAVKDSLALTKGALLTTIGSHSLFNIITLGFISPLLEPGTNSVLYGQYRSLTDAGKPKPKPHLLSKLILVVIVGLVLLVVLGIVLLAFAANNYMSTSP